MSISNVASLYQKLDKGAEGGHEFSRIIKQLLIADGKERNYETLISSDSSGDYKGVDVIIKKHWRGNNKYTFIGIQCKFFPSNLSSNHKHEIKSSLIKAIEKFPEMAQWIITTPEDFIKTDMEWFDSLKNEFEFIPTLEESVKKFMNIPGAIDKRELQIAHWGHTDILAFMLNHPDVGKYYYQELFSGDQNKLVLSKVFIDSTQFNWHRSNIDDDCIIYDPDSKKSNELIFDFQFINNTTLIHHLHQIDVVIEAAWTELKGIIIGSEILKSIGNIEIELDFHKKTNSIILDERIGGPIIFKAHESKRFTVQLTKIMTKCPGNMARIHFRFIFNSTSIRTNSYTLSF